MKTFGKERVRPSTQAAFTLIELLVVVAIIGLLIALLVPGLRTARDMARSTTCKNNLRGWGVATFLYVDEHGDRLPSSQTTPDPPGGLRSTAWYDYGRSLGYGPNAERCPAYGPSSLRVTTDRSVVPVTSNYWSGGYNTTFDPNNRQNYTPNGFWFHRNDRWSDPYSGLRMNQLNHPSRIVLMGDGNTRIFPWGEPSNAFRYRHGPGSTRINVTMFDGRVEEWDVEDCRKDGDQQLVTPPMRTPPLWKI